MNIKHIMDKIKDVGLINCVKVFLKRKKFLELQKKHHFDDWHAYPFEARKYLQEVEKYVSSKNADVVVDIGCGLGELLRHIKAKRKIGLDIGKANLAAANELGGDIEFSYGSFDELNMKESIDYVITLGFTHGGTEDMWRDMYTNCANRNDIKCFIVDTVPDDGSSHYLHYDQIFPSNYKLTENMGQFLGGLVIEVYRKMEA